MYQTAQLIKQEEWVSPDAQRCMPANTQDIHLVLERDKNLNIDHCRALKRRQSYCFAALHCKPDELHCAVLDFLLCLAFCICQSSRNEFGLTWICDQQNATVYSAAYFFPINVHMIVLSIDLHSFFFFFFFCPSAEGDSHGEDARQRKPAGLSRLLLGVPEQAESQQLQQRQLVPGQPQRRLPRGRREERRGLLQGGRALLLQLLEQARGGSRGLAQWLAVRQLLLLHQPGLKWRIGAMS